MTPPLHPVPKFPSCLRAGEETIVVEFELLARSPDISTVAVCEEVDGRLKPPNWAEHGRHTASRSVVRYFIYFAPTFQVTLAPGVTEALALALQTRQFSVFVVTQ